MYTGHNVCLFVYVLNAMHIIKQSVFSRFTTPVKSVNYV